MSTRGLIAIRDADGTCRSIYCHHDAYPSCAGAVLKEHYKTHAEVEELLTLGDLSSLDETIADCDAYHRDHDEPKLEARKWATVGEMIAKAWDYYNAEYVYVFCIVSYEWACYATGKRAWLNEW